MQPGERRSAILNILRQSDAPVSAAALAKRFAVSRQIIVGDVELLRASQHDIAATPRGYVLQKPFGAGFLRTIACCHTGEDALRAELYAAVDNGCAVLDVTVDHPVYGELRGALHIFSRRDVDAFVEKLSSLRASPLSSLTGGVHLHTLHCPDEDAFLRVCRALKDLHILQEEA